MYIPRHFEITDREKIGEFVEANGFGQLISSVDGRLFSSHIPFLLSQDRKKLLGHVAKQNPQWKELEQQEVLITFQGSHGYISPAWYSTPGVPTWNYQAVHIYGQCKLVNEPERLAELVEALTEKYESSNETPWRGQYDESLLRAIVGFEILITKILCKFKLGQNRSRQDREGVVEQLEAGGAVLLAEAMRNEF